MLITRTSMLSGCEHTVDLDVTAEQMKNYATGMLLQDAFPHLPRAEREFIKTGITAHEWDSIFGGMDDEDASVDLLKEELYEIDQNIDYDEGNYYCG